MFDVALKANRKYGQCLFYVALTIFLFSSFCFFELGEHPMLGECIKWGRRIATLLCFARLSLLALEHPRYSISCFCLFFVFFVSSRLSLENKLAYSFLLVAASRGTDFKVTLRIYLVFFASMLILDPVLYNLGLAGNTWKQRFGMRGNSWGFPNPNTLGYVMMMLAMAICCLAEPFKRPSRLFLISWGMVLAIGLVTLSATSTSVLFLFPVVFCIIRKVKPSGALCASFPFCLLLLSILLAMCFGAGLGETTFGSRFSTPSLSYKLFGLTWLGHDFGIVPPSANLIEDFERLWLDNLFLCLPLRDGIIPALITISFLSYLLYRYSKMDKPVLLAAAVCIVLSGMMEEYPSNFILNFTLMGGLTGLEECSGRGRKHLSRTIFALTAVVCFFIYSPWTPWADKDNGQRSRIKGIPVPAGFERVSSEAGSYAAFLGDLPLASEDEPVSFYDSVGVASQIEPYRYRNVDMPLISSFEQCADVCIHFRSEYLFRNHQWFKMHFEDTQHHTMRYQWIAGNLEVAHRRFLEHVYEWANTESLRNEMEPRRCLDDIEPGDVWCYDANCREGVSFGHAMTVADVAVCPQTGEKLFLLVQGSTPACSIHILKNTVEPGISPWFRLNGKSDMQDFGFARYKSDELYHFTSSTWPRHR